MSPAAQRPGRVACSLLRLDPVWTALAAQPALRALRFEPEIDARASLLAASASAAEGALALQLAAQDLDRQPAPAPLAGLLGAQARPASKQRRLDTVYAPDTHARQELAGLVLGESAQRQQAVLDGAQGLVAQRCPWLLLARDATTLRVPGYADASPALPGAVARHWQLLRADKGPAPGPELDITVQAIEAACSAPATIAPAEADWGWGLIPSAFPDERFRLLLASRGAVGLVIPGWLAGSARLRWRIRRDEALQDVAAPRASVGGGSAPAVLAWEGREGWLSVALPRRTLAGPVLATLQWGSRALLLRPFSADSGLALDTLALEPSGATEGAGR